MFGLKLHMLGVSQIAHVCSKQLIFWVYKYVKCVHSVQNLIVQQWTLNTFTISVMQQKWRTGITGLLMLVSANAS